MWMWVKLCDLLTTHTNWCGLLNTDSGPLSQRSAHAEECAQKEPKLTLTLTLTLTDTGSAVLTLMLGYGTEAYSLHTIAAICDSGLSPVFYTSTFERRLKSNLCSSPDN